MGGFEKTFVWWFAPEDLLSSFKCSAFYDVPLFEGQTDGRKTPAKGVFFFLTRKCTQKKMSSNVDEKDK